MVGFADRRFFVVRRLREGVPAIVEFELENASRQPRDEPESGRRMPRGCDRAPGTFSCWSGSDGEGDGVLVDIGARMKFNSLQGAVVSSYSVKASERVPRPERGQPCPRDTRMGNETRGQSCPRSSGYVLAALRRLCCWAAMNFV